MERCGMRTNFKMENHKGWGRFEVLDVEGRLILKWVPEKCGRMMLTGFIWMKEALVVGS
jgi:hypothetical protein